MVNKIFYGMCITFFSFLLFVLPVKADTLTGVVLDEEGNGMLLDETLKPTDPYYNYISYKGIDAPVGALIITVETLDENGEVEERNDFVTPDRVTREVLNRCIKIHQLNNELTRLVWEVK